MTVRVEHLSTAINIGGVATVYLLAKGPENRIDEVPRAEAARALLRNILFFAEDPA